MGFFNTVTICLFGLMVSIFSVSVGGTSLITVPVLILLGFNSKISVATNMFALIFLSLAGTIGFRKRIKPIQARMMIPLIGFVLFGSFMGASCIPIVDETLLQKVIAIITGVMALYLLFNNKLGIDQIQKNISKFRFLLGTALVFILSIYGGFFSGGYITLLSYVFILIFKFDLLQAAYATKICNIFSSFVASIVFYRHDLIEFSVAIPLSIFMIFGAFWGARLAIAKGNRWIKKVFIVVIAVFAVKLAFLP